MSERFALRIRGGVRTRIDFMQLRKGDIFLLVEADGSIVDNGEVCVAECDAYLEKGLKTIRCRPVEYP